MAELSNVERRAGVLAQIEVELKRLLPDEGAPAVKSARATPPSTSTTTPTSSPFPPDFTTP